jgi:hypothetical protein
LGSPWTGNATLDDDGASVPLGSLTVTVSRGASAPTIGCSPMAVTVTGVRAIRRNLTMVARLTVVPSLLAGPCIDCGQEGGWMSCDTQVWKEGVEGEGGALHSMSEQPGQTLKLALILGGVKEKIAVSFMNTPAPSPASERALISVHSGVESTRLLPVAVNTDDAAAAGATAAARPTTRSAAAARAGAAPRGLLIILIPMWGVVRRAPAAGRSGCRARRPPREGGASVSGKKLFAISQRGVHTR